MDNRRKKSPRKGAVLKQSHEPRTVVVPERLSLAEEVSFRERQGELIRRKREELDLQQKHIAQKLDLTDARALWRIETGRAPISTEQLAKLAQLFGTTIERLTPSHGEAEQLPQAVIRRAPPPGALTYAAVLQVLNELECTEAERDAAHKKLAEPGISERWGAGELRGWVAALRDFGAQVSPPSPLPTKGIAFRRRANSETRISSVPPPPPHSAPKKK